MEIIEIEEFFMKKLLVISLGTDHADLNECISFGRHGI